VSDVYEFSTTDFSNIPSMLKKGDQYLASGDELFEKGEFEKALKEYAKNPYIKLKKNGKIGIVQEDV